MMTKSITLFALDLGTTHCKAGLFDLDGQALYIASVDNQARRSPQGYSYYDLEALWRRVESLQAEADVFGCPLDVPAQKEATLLGAALLAGIGSGVYPDAQSAAERWGGCGLERSKPDAARHVVYRQIYEGAIPCCKRRCAASGLGIAGSEKNFLYTDSNG